MNWKVVKTAGGELEIVSLADEEDLTVGYRYLEALAREANTLKEVEPGVWRRPEDPEL